MDVCGLDLSLKQNGGREETLQGLDLRKIKSEPDQEIKLEGDQFWMA